jgi:hypothetical protein
MTEFPQITMDGAACTMDDVTYRRGRILLEAENIPWNPDQPLNFLSLRLGIADMVRSRRISAQRFFRTEGV